MNVKLEEPGRMKIILAKTDMQKLDITFDQLDYNNPKTRKILWDILSETGTASKFLVSGSKLLIEVFPAPDHGCIIYFTLLKKDAEAYKRVRLKKQNTLPIIFEFANSEDMLCAIDKLFKETKGGVDQSYLYRFGNKYRLVIFLKQAHTNPVLALLNEFGKNVGQSFTQIAFTEEHGHLLAKSNAIETVGKYLAKPPA